MAGGQPSKLARMLRPRHIAFVGGTQIGGSIRACRRAAYTGTVFVVNPSHTEIEGTACTPSIPALPYPPDAAVIGLSPERSIEAVAELSALGAGGAVVMSAGFAELGDAGAERQYRLKHAAGDMPVLGPNCMGILNQFDGAVVWGDDNHVERPEGPGAAIISQSGAMLIGITNVEEGFPLGYAISVGNQAVVDVADCIEAVLEDERVRAIGLYLEGIDDGDALGRACLAASSSGIPVVALKGGDAAAGAAIAISHTAAMVVERDLWNAFCARFGLVEVSSPKALVESLKLLTIGGVPRGNRVAILSYSGGVNGLAAVRAGSLGLDLPQPDGASLAALREMLPETVALTNPLDLNIPFRSKNGISLEDTHGVARAIAEFARDIADQVAFLIDVPRADTAGLDRLWSDSLDALTDLSGALDVPCAVAGILPEGLGTELRRHLARNGVAPLLGFAETMEALSVGARLHALRERGHAAPAPGPLYAGPVPDAGAILNEARSKSELIAHGLAVPAFETAPIERAAEAADRLGYPVALKVLSDAIAHKARVGGVRLGLGSAEAVRAAAARMSSDVSGAEGGHPVSEVLVERMIDGAVAELIIGVKRHPALGLALVIGRGGVAAEAIHAFETLLLPLDDRELGAALSRLGFGDHRALAAAARAVASYAEADHRRLVALDVNPVILTHDGEALAADALIVLASGDG